METYEPTDELVKELSCNSCAAVLKYKPGSKHLKCQYCGSENSIEEEDKKTVVVEIDFNEFLSKQENIADTQVVSTVKCNGCGASVTLKPNITSDSCVFCGTALVITSGSSGKLIRPKYLLPFKIDNKEATSLFKNWIAKLWFAPNDLKKYVHTTEKLNGVYIPYWTYDSNTFSNYTGEQGIDYQHIETYTTTVNGQSVTRTRTVTRTRWYPVSGSVNNNFNDVLVLASNSLPHKNTNALEPWDMEELTDFNEKFLAGFLTESYQVGVKEGFDTAKQIMDESIRDTIRKNIGGNHQRIHSVDTSYNDITFKHILLPIWISAFRYKEKAYRFLVNGRSGEVQGERPYSALKITLAVLGGLAVIGVAIYIIYLNNH